MTKIVELPSHKKIKISIWDTAGQERYKALSKVYYKGANAAIVVYDITNPNSYVDVESWMKLLSNTDINQTKTSTSRKLPLPLLEIKLTWKTKDKYPKNVLSKSTRSLSTLIAGKSLPKLEKIFRNCFTIWCKVIL